MGRTVGHDPDAAVTCDLRGWTKTDTSCRVSRSFELECGGTTLTIKYLADANCRRWCVAGDEAVFTAAAPVDAFEERPEEEEEEACPP